METKPLILTQIIKASPEEDTSGPISPPPLKPNMAHKAWYVYIWILNRITVANGDIDNGYNKNHF